jgi:hypothetical protein
LLISLQAAMELRHLRVLAEADSREGHQLDDFLDKNHFPHRLVDPASEYGKTLAQRLNLAPKDLPPLITPEGREVARGAGLLQPLAGEEEEEIRCDVAIVGAGPAGPLPAKGLTSRWSQPPAAVKSTFDFTKQFLMFAALAAANGAPVLSARAEPI